MKEKLDLLNKNNTKTKNLNTIESILLLKALEKILKLIGNTDSNFLKTNKNKKDTKILNSKKTKKNYLKDLKSKKHKLSKDCNTPKKYMKRLAENLIKLFKCLLLIIFKNLKLAQCLLSPRIIIINERNKLERKKK